MPNFDMAVTMRAVLAFLTAGLISFALTPLAKKFAIKIGAIDVPKDDRRMHTKPIPRLGGIAVFIGFLITAMIFVDINRPLQGILIGALIIVLLGIIDDVIPLHAVLKLMVQIIAALIVIWHGTRIDVLSNPNIWSDVQYIHLSAIWSYPITLIWIVIITNSVNLIDGLDGLSVGVSSIASITLLLIAIIVSELNIVLIMAALAGACIGFLPYNLNPAKIFLGDTGSTFLGFILACISIHGLFKFYAIISFAVPFLVLGLPIFDTLFAVFRRISHGKSPMSADRGHVHHRLMDMGFNQKQSVAIYIC